MIAPADNKLEPGDYVTYAGNTGYVSKRISGPALITHLEVHFLGPSVNDPIVVTCDEEGYVADWHNEPLMVRQWRSGEGLPPSVQPPKLKKRVPRPRDMPAFPSGSQSIPHEQKGLTKFEWLAAGIFKRYMSIPESDPRGRLNAVNHAVEDAESFFDYMEKYLK